MNCITTVIFDMYNTLVQNDADRWIVTFREIIREQGLDISADRLWEEWRSLDRKSRAERIKPGAPFRTYSEFWRETFVGAFAVLGLRGDPEAAVKKSIGDLSRRAAYPETVEALGLIGRQWRTAVLSNADDSFLLPNLEHLGLKFEVVLSSEEAREYKPQPGLFREVLRRLGVTPQESVYVGDRQFEDVQGAKQAGIKAVWINRGGDPLDPQLREPDHQIGSLLELPALLPEWLPAKDGA